MPDIAAAEEAEPQPVYIEDASKEAADVAASQLEESKEEAEVAGADAPPAALTVDTAAAEDEEEQAISASDAQSAQPAELSADGVSSSAAATAAAAEPVPEAAVAAPAYGAEHGWCPGCIAQRPHQQQEDESQQAPREDEDGDEDDDALALSWPEQALFACGADHLDAIVSSQSALFPPAASLPPFAPVAVCVIGPPLTGRTTLALRLAAELRLTYLALPALLASHCSRRPELAPSLSAEAELPLELLMDALCAEIVEAVRRGGSRGWVLDGWPRTREEAEMLEQRGILLRQVVVLGLETGQQAEGDEAVAAAVDRRCKERQQREERESGRQRALKTARLAALALAAERRRKEEEQQAQIASEANGAVESDEAEEAQADSDDTAVAADVEGAAESEAGQDSSAADSASDASPAAAVSTTGDESVAAAVVTVQLSVLAEGEVAIAVRPADAQQPVTDAEESAAPAAAEPLQRLLSSLSASLSGEQWSQRAAAFDALLSFLSSRRLLAYMPGPPSVNAALPDALQLLSRLSSARLAHFAAVAASLPSSLSRLPFPQSLLLTNLTPFGDYCCVCFHEGRGLRDLSSAAAAAASRIVQYRRGLLRVCDEQEEQRLLQDAPRYCDASSFPTDFPARYPQDNDGQDGLQLQYEGCCPVSIAAWQAGQAQWVQPGREDSAAVYTRRVFRCASAAALADFLSFPERFSSLSVPSPLPVAPSLPSALSLLQSGQTLPFLHAAFMAPLSAALSRVAEHRQQLLFPSLSVRRTACLLLSLCLRGDDSAVERFLQDCAVTRRVAAEMGRGEAAEGRDDGLLLRYDQLSRVMADGDLAEAAAPLPAAAVSRVQPSV